MKQPQLTDKQLDILHDHYKETFARIREVEALRERLFLGVIGLFALLSLEIGYPAALGGTLGSFTVLGGELNLQALPLPALLNATWALTLAVALRYCRSAVFVTRQYPYLHYLEEVISPALGGGKTYHREGKVYLDEYPLLLEFSWFIYGILFPLMVIAATGALITWELTQLAYPLVHLIIDGVIAAAIVVFYFTYRVQPSLARIWRSGKQKWIDRKYKIRTVKSKGDTKTPGAG